MNLKNRLRKLRKDANLNQEELGEKIGLSGRTISALERGESKPSPEDIIALSDFFKVSTDYLLKGVETERTISENEQEIIEIMRKDSDFSEAVRKAAGFKKKAINYLSHYQQQHAQAA